MVEDNEIDQIVVTELLKFAGINYTVANHGQEALDIMQTHSFDAVLMDMQMPVMGGIEDTTYIRQNPAFVDLPVIALTAGVTQEERERCIACGMNDDITKPVNSEAVISCLVHWINLNRQHKMSANKLECKQPKSISRTKLAHYWGQRYRRVGQEHRSRSISFAN
ncbi:MAG: CheY-like chemotaxis protein [Flavobacteriales bacterium]